MDIKIEWQRLQTSTTSDIRVTCFSFVRCYMNYIILLQPIIGRKLSQPYLSQRNNLLFTVSILSY